MQIPEPLQIAIDELSKLPSIGRKTAMRLALHLLSSDQERIDSLIHSIADLKAKIGFCTDCFNFSVNELCDICSNPKRDKTILCVVEEASDIIAIERTNEFSGIYHVLGGVLSPLDGSSVESLNIRELLSRLRESEIKEVILALNPNTEGESTSLYLAKLLKPLSLNISRIARGLPIGGDLEFADEATIGRAVLGRISL
ncbi:MAG: recombination mediator RecR [Melioribacteraceae bacterium]|nr:recombination mediator RecR [Melioribacteraceae bacterium]MCF8265189.1 recombination mediator RecR [Melioribacteraceae bacterium]MCF8413760.1 recombination mediator RecR [Melioribacteraceae bacterium]MCF8431128.1 recombination mediator RecR [Melioribacteraceae bacterium]